MMVTAANATLDGVKVGLDRPLSERDLRHSTVRLRGRVARDDVHALFMTPHRGPPAVSVLSVWPLAPWHCSILSVAVADVAVAGAAVVVDLVLLRATDLAQPERRS